MQEDESSLYAMHCNMYNKIQIFLNNQTEIGDNEILKKKLDQELSEYKVDVIKNCEEVILKIMLIRNEMAELDKIESKISSRVIYYKTIVVTCFCILTVLVCYKLLDFIEW